MKMQKLLLTMAIFVFTAFFSACSQDSSYLNDGYYTAEASFFDTLGWKEYITVYVSGGQIITVEYDAFNASGFIKSWDVDYMRSMTAESGTYPNEYSRTYAISLINWQNPAEIDAVSGATHSYTKFQLLAEAVMAKARAGDKHVALVDLPE